MEPYRVGQWRNELYGSSYQSDFSGKDIGGPGYSQHSTGTGNDPLDEGPPVQTVQKRVMRQMEVPCTRQVQVPVKERKVVDTVVQKKVPWKKWVEVPSYEMVEEEYVDIEERPAVRQKVIWVKKIVDEHYMEKVEVKKKRMVKKETTTLQEVEGFHIVEIPSSEVVEVDGFRVDEVPDVKLVEVEEVQEYELVPVMKGEARVLSQRDIGLRSESRSQSPRPSYNSRFQSNIYVDGRGQEFPARTAQGSGRPASGTVWASTGTSAAPSYMDSDQRRWMGGREGMAASHPSPSSSPVQRMDGSDDGRVAARSYIADTPSQRASTSPRSPSRGRRDEMEASLANRREGREEGRSGRKELKGSMTPRSDNTQQRRMDLYSMVGSASVSSHRR